MNSLYKSNPDKYYLIVETNDLKAAINCMTLGDSNERYYNFFNENYKGDIKTLERIKENLTYKADKFLKIINKINNHTNLIAKKYLPYDGAGYLEDYDGITIEMIVPTNMDLSDYDNLPSYYSIKSLNERRSKMFRRCGIKCRKYKSP